MSNPEDVNPYQAPSLPGLFSSQEPSYFNAEAEAGITPKIVESLAKTQPWVRFLSVLGFIGFALLAVAAIGALVVALSGRNPGRFASAVIFAILAIVYLLPSVFLSRFASDIGRLRISLRVRDLEDALQSQQSFWTFAGIATLVMIVFYLLLIAVVVASGAALTMSRSPF